MAATKIFRSDLAFDVESLINDVEASRGAEATLSDRLLKIIQDYQAADSTLQTTTQDLDTRLQDVETSSSTSGDSFARLEMRGNITESFTYDVDGDIQTITATGDVTYSETFAYKMDGAEKVLDYSERTYAENGKTVKIKRVYGYTSGNISSITTTTTLT